MNEVEWVEHVAARLRKQSWLSKQQLCVQTGLKLAYGCEIATYGSTIDPRVIRFATDLALTETTPPERWKPRVVVEAKLGSITTHDAITYSQKAAVHRAVHPYLRYGVMLGNRKNHPLPGRLYRHGAQFDFMISFCSETPTGLEMSRLVDVLKGEVAASKTLEEIMYQSRKPGRRHYTLLHRQLRVAQ
jgi:hypothetical protein